MRIEAGLGKRNELVDRSRVRDEQRPEGELDSRICGCLKTSKAVTRLLVLEEDPDMS